MAERSEQAQVRGESEQQRLDRNLDDLLQELRVAFPGVQFLFAFLLVVPFQKGWAEVNATDKDVYYVALVLTAIASICFIAPSARHRLRFRDQDKEWLVKSSNRLMVAGLVCLGGAITSALLLVTMVVFSEAFAIVAAAIVAVMIAWAWFGAPLLRESRHD